VPFPAQWRQWFKRVPARSIAVTRFAGCAIKTKDPDSRAEPHFFSSMPPSRLILIDGLPGSGKTITTQQLWLHLESLGFGARWWFEHEFGHPIIDCDEASAARESVLADPHGIFARALAGWAALADRLNAGAASTLLESTLFQTVAGTQLLMDRPHAEIEAQFDRTIEIIAPLDPVLIDLRQTDVAAALRVTCARREPSFTELLLTSFGPTARGRRIGRNDFAAVLDYCVERRALTDALFDRFPGRKLAYDNSDRDWARQRRAVTDFLGLPPMNPPALPDRAGDYAGRYRAATGDEELTVVADAAGLHVVGDKPTALFPHGRDRFALEGYGVEFNFVRRADGAVEGIRCAESLRGMATHWIKV
jgi:hypothetical protein